MLQKKGYNLVSLEIKNFFTDCEHSDDRGEGIVGADHDQRPQERALLHRHQPAGLEQPLNICLHQRLTFLFFNIFKLQLSLGVSIGLDVISIEISISTPKKC